MGNLLQFQIAELGNPAISLKHAQNNIFTPQNGTSDFMAKCRTPRLIAHKKSFCYIQEEQMPNAP